jgi:hypothetical protein
MSICICMWCRHRRVRSSARLSILRERKTMAATRSCCWIWCCSVGHGVALLSSGYRTERPCAEPPGRRLKLVKEKTAILNRLTSRLKLYFPQMLEWLIRWTPHWSATCWGAALRWSSCRRRRFSRLRRWERQRPSIRTIRRDSRYDSASRRMPIASNNEPVAKDIMPPRAA